MAMTEAERQHALLQAVLGASPADAAAWRAPRAGWQRGLQVYQANAGAAAERALAAAYPTVAALIGAESMAGLARVFWRAHPPQRGDLAEFGKGLPAFIARSEVLATEPYLADVAALDWAVHHAQRAADAPAGGVQQLERLGDTDPARLRLQLVPGTMLLRSRWPIVEIFQAHLPLAEGEEGSDRSARFARFAPVREAMAAGRGDNALVWREGWPVRVAALGEAEAVFTRAVLAGQRLSCALEAAPDLDFAGWLGDALQRSRLAAVAVDPPEGGTR